MKCQYQARKVSSHAYVMMGVSILPLSTIWSLDFGGVPTVMYFDFGGVPTVMYFDFGGVPTVMYFDFHFI